MPSDLEDRRGVGRNNGRSTRVDRGSRRSDGGAMGNKVGDGSMSVGVGRLLQRLERSLSPLRMRVGWNCPMHWPEETSTWLLLSKILLPSQFLLRLVAALAPPPLFL